MHAVADDFCRDLVRLQHGPHQPRSPMVESRHPVEQVSRLAGACRNGRERFLISRPGMSERDVMSASREPAHEIEPSLELGSERNDSHVGRRALDLGEDVGGLELWRLPQPT